MLDNLADILCDAIRYCILYRLKEFLSIAATIFLVSAFLTSTVSLYNFRASLNSACRRCVSWNDVLVRMRSGAGIKCLSYGVPGETSS